MSGNGFCLLRFPFQFNETERSTRIPMDLVRLQSWLSPISENASCVNEFDCSSMNMREAHGYRRICISSGIAQFSCQETYHVIYEFDCSSRKMGEMHGYRRSYTGSKRVHQALRDCPSPCTKIFAPYELRIWFQSDYSTEKNQRARLQFIRTERRPPLTAQAEQTQKYRKADSVNGYCIKNTYRVCEGEHLTDAKTSNKVRQGAFHLLTQKINIDINC